MTRDELWELAANDSIDPRIKRWAISLRQAEIDWRTTFNSVEDFLEEIEKILGAETSKQEIERQQKIYGMSAMHYLWELESFSFLIEAFEYQEHMTLKEIFQEIQQKLR